MRYFLIRAIALFALLGGSVAAETLDEWLLQKLRTDEQLQMDAISQTNGHSVDLLKSSRTYVPFFLDPPRNVASASPTQKLSFETWGRERVLLPGGYIFRMRFQNAPSLYVTSAGEWSGTWRSLSLEKDIKIEPCRIWEGVEGEYLYATKLAGTTPRLIFYSQQGEVMREEVLDVSAAEAVYPPGSMPVLELLSLAEYLLDPKAAWRVVDLSGQYNFRNQEERDTERERLKTMRPLSRSAAIQMLQ